MSGGLTTNPLESISIEVFPENIVFSGSFFISSFLSKSLSAVDLQTFQ